MATSRIPPGLAPCAALLMLLASCVPVHLSTCERTSCSPANVCFTRGAGALEAGRPDEALCLFRRALSLGSQDSQTRIGLGTSLLILGKPIEARSHFQWVAERSHDDDQRRIAHDWLTAIANPLPVTVLSLAAQHCPSQDNIAENAAGSLRLILNHLGSFRVVGSSPMTILPLFLGLPTGGRFGAETCAKARSRGARVAVVVEVICGDLEVPQNPTLWSGVDRRQVTVNVAVYQTSTCGHRFSLTTTVVGSSILSQAATAAAVDRAVRRLVVPLSHRLLIGTTH